LWEFAVIYNNIAAVQRSVNVPDKRILDTDGLIITGDFVADHKERLPG